MNKFLVLAVVMATAADAATISDIATSVGADGVVTVTYSLDADAIVTADFRENGVSLGGTNQWSLAGDVFKLVSAGTGKMTWNAAKDIPGQQLSAVTVELKAWAESDAPDYLIADLMYGSTCRLRYYPSVDYIPGGIVADEAYRMYYLPLRKIRAKNVSWTMGTTSEKGRSTSNEDAHQVMLDANYYIGVFELTHAQCAACEISRAGNYNEEYRWRMTPQNRTPWNGFRGSTLPPAEPSISSPFGKIRDRTGLLVDFPTEAQWEYAARGGHRASPSATAYAGSDNIGSVGWYWNNSPQYQTENIRHTSEVRGKQPNELNIYDMTGNVREWCADWYSPLGTAAVTDPEGLSSAGYGRVYRGGSCNDSAQYCRVAHREGLSSSSKSYNIGFRVVITMD